MIDDPYSGGALSYSPGSDVTGLTYSPSGTSRQPNPSSLMALLWAASGGSGGSLAGLSNYSGNPPFSGMMSAGGAGYTPNSGSAGSSSGTQDIGLANTIAKNLGTGVQLYTLGNLGSKAATGTGLGTGIGNLLAGYDWSGMASGSLLSSLSAQAAADVANGLGTGGAIVGAGGLGAAGASTLAGLDAATLATIASASPALSGLSGLAAAALLAP